MKFKVGDRVRVYEFINSFSAVVNKIRGDYLILQQGDEILSSPRHHKQCRKLLKKKRRSVWVPVHHLENSIDLGCNEIQATLRKPDPIMLTTFPPIKVAYIEFREVKRK